MLPSYAPIPQMPWGRPPEMNFHPSMFAMSNPHYKPLSIQDVNWASPYVEYAASGRGYVWLIAGTRKRISVLSWLALVSRFHVRNVPCLPPVQLHALEPAQPSAVALRWASNVSLRALCLRPALPSWLDQIYYGYTLVRSISWR